jgi:hypothetical protein
MYEEVDDEINGLGGVGIVALKRKSDIMERNVDQHRPVWDRFLRYSKRAKKPMISRAREKVVDSARRGSVVDYLITSNEFRKLSDSIYYERKKGKTKKKAQMVKSV